jgi:prevent-host-death family protein
MTVQVIDSRDARTKWRDIMDAAAAGAETVIERYGKPTAVVIPFADYEALREDLDDLRAGRRAQAAIEAWQKDPSLGRPWEEIKAEMIRDGLLDA